MNILNINKAIQDPAQIQSLSKEDVFALLKKYPYCASLHLILTKLLHLENNTEYQNQLAHTAAYANDRKALYRLIYETGSIKDSGSSISKQDFTENFADPISTILNFASDSDISEKASQAQNESNEQVEATSDESLALEELEAQHVEHVIENLETEFELMNRTGSGEIDTQQIEIDEENDEGLVDEHLDPEMQSNISIVQEIAEQEIIEEIKNSGIEALSTALAAEDLPNNKIPVHTESKEVPESISAQRLEEAVENTSRLRDVVSMVQIPATVQSNIIESQQRTFTAWLKQFSATKENHLVPPPPVNSFVNTEELSSEMNNTSATTNNLVNDDTLTSQYQEEQASVFFKETEADLNRIIKDEIKHIDEFVQAQPKKPINLDGELLVSVSELAKRSLDDSKEIITETMARVFAAQGKFKKAIDILEKLELLHPEKRLYFAALIEEFKKQNI